MSSAAKAPDLHRDSAPKTPLGDFRRSDPLITSPWKNPAALMAVAAVAATLT